MITGGEWRTESEELRQYNEAGGGELIQKKCL